MSLYAADGTLIGSPVAVAPDALDGNQKLCGGPDQEDDPVVGCGNQSTRWIGFSGDDRVRYMLVSVGDDDSCEEKDVVNNAQNCNGRTEFLSFIGPTVAVAEPQLSLTKVLSADGATSPGAQWQFLVEVGGDQFAGATDDDGLLQMELPLVSGPVDITVIEPSGVGWILGEVTCTVTPAGGSATPIATELAEGGFVLPDVPVSAAVVCEVVNVADTTLTVIKETLVGEERSAASGWEFEVTTDAGPLSGTTGPDGSAVFTMSSPTPLDVTIVETRQQGWYPTGLECVGVMADAPVTLSVIGVDTGEWQLRQVPPGSELECVATNEPVHLDVDKSGPSGELHPGDTVVYTVTVANDGQVTARNVTLHDELPVGVTALSAAAPGWTCTITPPRTVDCTLNFPLIAGAVAPVVTIVGTVDEAVTGELLNTALVNSSLGSWTDDHPVMVTPAPTTTVPPTTTTMVRGQIPETGTDSGGLASQALLVVGAGTALMLASLRRRRPNS